MVLNILTSFKFGSGSLSAAILQRYGFFFNLYQNICFFAEKQRFYAFFLAFFRRFEKNHLVFHAVFVKFSR